MLRVSARKTDRQAELRSIVNRSVDSQLPSGGELLDFVDAAIARDTVQMTSARARLVEAAGQEATIRAATVCGNFQMMNRLLDAIGVRTSKAGMMLADELGLTVPEHLHP